MDIQETPKGLECGCRVIYAVFPILLFWDHFLASTVPVFVA